MRPLAIDLYAGLGGWTEGLLAEGYRVIGFDIERHAYGDARYPSQLVLQDVRTIHGAQFKDAALIVASPPCQAYSYMAMPWRKAKSLLAEYKSGDRDVKELTALFDACFRIQREACEVAGRHIPLVVENVCGAQKWVGRARWHYGSFYLWGDVPALMPMTKVPPKVGDLGWQNARGGIKPEGYHGGAFTTTAEQRLKATKNDGGSWFNVAHNTTSWLGRNPVSRPPNNIANGADGCKQKRSGAEWWRGEVGSHSSKSKTREAASAHIAKIPEPLARWIARAWHP